MSDRYMLGLAHSAMTFYMERQNWVIVPKDGYIGTLEECQRRKVEDFMPIAPIPDHYKMGFVKTVAVGKDRPWNYEMVGCIFDARKGDPQLDVRQSPSTRPIYVSVFGSDPDEVVETLKTESTAVGLTI